ncbi:MAG: RNA methyltransferase [Clostridia bacterium]|nr:RNA methyltransferase [Clostridia bacterium]
MVITSKSNNTVKYISSLKDKKFRNKYGQYVVEGRKMVREALLYGKPVSIVVGTEEALIELLTDIPENVEVLTVTDEVMNFMSDAVTPQGVMAVITKENFDGKCADSVCVMLDGVSDPGNMGTIIRTAAAVGIKRLYLANCCDPYSPKTVRSSMSGIYFVEIVEGERQEILGLLEGVPLIIADMGGQNVFEFTPPKEYCLVVGNEANGISDEVKKKADKIIGIPMDGKVESLNAAVSFAVSIYALTYGPHKTI